MSVPEEVIHRGQSPPAILPHSQQSDHDAGQTSDKQDKAPQQSGHRSHVSAASKWTQILLEDISKDRESDSRFPCAVSKSKTGDVLAGNGTCTSSMLVFEDISLDGGDWATQKQVEHTSTEQALNSFSNELCVESSKRGTDLVSSGGTGLSKHGRSGGQIESSVAVVPDPDTGIHSRKRSHPISGDDTIMDHSGLEESSGKRSRLCVKDGVMQCLRLQGVKKGDSCPPERVAEELARCLHEPKFQLLMKVVQVLGAEKALELFEETAQIQEEGGTLTADGNKRKSPGGVFLTLVKTSATPEQRKEIFQVDKAIIARRAKQEKKRKANEWWKKERQRELAVMKQKAEWELRIFRSQIGEDCEAEQTLKAGLKCPRKDLNMHKRLPASALLNTERTSSSSCTAEGGLDHLMYHKENGISSRPLTPKSRTGEAMEVESSGLQDCDSRKRSHQQQHGLKAVAETDQSKGGRKVALAEERLAAEEFERMNECDLDFGIDLA